MQIHNLLHNRQTQPATFRRAVRSRRGYEAFADSADEVFVDVRTVIRNHDLDAFRARELACFMHSCTHINACTRWRKRNRVFDHIGHRELNQIAIYRRL